MTAIIDRSASGNVMASSRTLSLPPSCTTTCSSCASNVARPSSRYSISSWPSTRKVAWPIAMMSSSLQLGLVDPGAVDERAVVAAQVDDLEPAGRRRPQLGVLLGHPQVLYHDVVVRAAPDLHDLGLDPHPRGGVAQHARHERGVHGTGLEAPVRPWGLRAVRARPARSGAPGRPRGARSAPRTGLVISSRMIRSEPRNVPLRLPRSSSTQTGPSARITACSHETRASASGMSARSSRPMRYSCPLSSRWVLRTVLTSSGGVA